MSKSSDSSADGPGSPAQIVISSTDTLAKHASDTIDVLIESLSATALIEDEPGSGSASHITSVYSSEATARGESERRARGIYGLEGEIGSGGQAVTGAGSKPGFVDVGGHKAGAHGPVSSIPASTVFRLPGEVSEPKARRSSPSHPSMTNELLERTSVDRGESSDGHGDEEYVDKKDDVAISSLEIFAFSSSSDPQKKRPETLAGSRWKKAYHLVKKDNAMKKRALSTPIGTGATLDGHALGLLSIHSRIRKTLFACLYNEYPPPEESYHQQFILILKAEYKWVTHLRPTVKALQVADIVLTSVSTAECVCRIVTLGFYKSPHAYLRNSYNKLDLVVLVDSWVHIVRTMILGRDAFIRLLVFRIYRALFILRQFTFIGNVLAAFGALGKSARPLELMLGFTLIFVLFYANVGVQFFGFTGSLRMRYFPEAAHLLLYKFVSEIVIAGAEENQTGSYPILSCFVAMGTHGRYIMNTTRWILVLTIKGYFARKGTLVVPRQSAGELSVVQVAGNPNYGLTHFENIGTTFLILVQILSFEGWSLIMIEVRNSFASTGSDAYFIVFIVIAGYFISNVFIAAFSGVFLRVRQEHQLLLRKYRREKAFSLANAVAMASVLKDVIVGDNQNLNWRQRLRRATSKFTRQFSRSFSREGSRLRTSFTRRITSLRHTSSFGITGLDNAGDILPPEPTGRFSFSRSLSNGARFGRSVSLSALSRIWMWEQKLSYKCRILVQSTLFTYGVLFTISLNSASLCTVSPKAALRHINAGSDGLQIGTLIIFYVELIVRFIAAGPYGFVDERINVLDTVVVLISSYALKIDKSKPPFPSILCIRLFRWFYVRRSSRRDRDEEGSPVLASMVRVAGSLASVFFSFLIVIIITSILSTEVWGGRMLLVDGSLPRANHDTMPQAMLLWFSVTTSESWVNQMWNVLRPGTKNRWLSPILFVIYWMMTAIALLNLIIAAILEETELTDYQKKLIQKREHVKWLQLRHIHRLSSSRSSDWLLGSIEYLKGVKRRISSIRVTRMSILPSSRSETPDVQEQRTGDMVLPTASSSPGSQTSEVGGRSETPEVQEQRTSDMVPPTASGSPVSQTSEVPSTIDTHMHLPGSGASDSMRASSSFRGLQISGRVSPKIFSSRAVEEVDAPADVKSRGRRLRRSSASALSSITATTFPPPLQRRLSQVSDKMFLRSGFTGADLAHTTADGGNRTALQAALLAVIDERAVDAGAGAAKEAGGQFKWQAPSDTVLHGRKRTSRVSFILSDFDAIQAIEEKAAPWWMNERSLFLFRAENRARLIIKKIVEHEIYRWWQVAWATVGTVIMMETYPDGLFRVGERFFVSLDWSTFAVFTIDLILKSVAYGFLLTREAYLEDPYNMIDVLNLLLHLLYLRDHMFMKGTETFAKAMLILMACRPYRLIPRFQGLRKLCSSLLRTIPAISQLLLFTIVVYAAFALVGLQLFSIRFRTCTDTTVTGHVDCIGMFYNDAGVLAPRTWVNAPFHFDTFGDSMLALFVASTFDSWMDYFLYRSMDLPRIPGHIPRRNVHVAYAIYFVAFACIGGFFILRMFVAVFIDRIGVMSGTKLLTERQKLWRDTNRLIQSTRPKRRPAVVTGFLIRGLCFRIVHARWFELVVVFLVCANVGYISGADYYMTAQGYINIMIPPNVLFALEYLFSALYALEALLKLLGHQINDWWYDKWNAVELVSIIMTFVCHKWQAVAVVSAIGRFIVLARIFRVYRYIRTLRTVANTILVSLPSMVDIVALMGICLCSLSQVGTQIFYNIKDGICIRNGGEASFETWLTSFLILLQVTTLDNWTCLMIDITLAPPNCVPDVSVFTSDCGFPVGGIVYMLICIFLTTYIFSNLFIAQILDTITFGLLNENALLSPAHLMAYRELWAHTQYDGKCTGYIPHYKLKEFLIELGHPLGGRRYGFVKWFSRIEYEIFHFRSRKGIPFRPLLETVCLYKVGSKALELPVRIQREKHIQTIYQNGAAMKIQGLVRGFLQRRKNRKDRLQELIDDDKERGSDPDDSPAEDPAMVSQAMVGAPTSAAAGEVADMMSMEAVAESPASHGYESLGREKS